MISVIDVVNLVKSVSPTARVYPLEFPVDSPDLAIVVSVTGSTKATAKVYPLNVQIKVRADHPAIAESTSIQLRADLQKKTNVSLGNVQVVFIEPINPFPLYVGKDGNSNFLYSTNYRFMINEGV
jgi:hypothetical protein